VNQLKTYIVTREKELPLLDDTNFFHSSQLFRLTRHTPRQKPYMVIAEDGDGQVVAHILAIVRYRTSWFPPYFFMHCRLLGEGDYAPTVSQRSEVFRQMLSTLRQRLGNRVLYIEVSNLGQKMFAYREFRQQQFFPVHWMSIHNSLHSHTPEERISERLQRQIDRAYERGVVTKEVETAEEFEAFNKLLRKHHVLKPKRFIPKEEFFRGISAVGHGRLYVTLFKNHVIGCSACAYSGNNAYLWYSAYRRKSFAFLHPDVLTVWHAIKDSHRRGYDHIFFLDVGLPFRRNPYREFILRFGGKPTSTIRWFRCSIKWINSLLSWFYRE
jgi:hypothetical protein